MIKLNVFFFFNILTFQRINERICLQDCKRKIYKYKLRLYLCIFNNIDFYFQLFYKIDTLSIF